MKLFFKNLLVLFFWLLLGLFVLAIAEAVIVSFGGTGFIACILVLAAAVFTLLDIEVAKLFSSEG